MAKAKKVEISREELESLVEEANTVLGLDPEMVIKRKMTDEQLIELIKENLDEVRESDFTEDAENGPFTEEARNTIDALGIAVEDDLEVEPVEAPKKAAKDKKVVEEEVEEAPVKKGAKAKKEVQEELPLEEVKTKKGAKAPHPKPPVEEPEEDEITLDAVNEMDFKQLKALVADKELDIEIADFSRKEVEDLRAEIIEVLELEEVVKEVKPAKKGKKEEVKAEPAKKGKKVVEEEPEDEKPVKKGAKPAAKADKPKAAKKDKGSKLYGRMDSILDSIKTNRCHTMEQHKEWSGKKYCKERDCTYEAGYSNEWLRVALTVLVAEGCCTINKKDQYDFKG